MFNLRLLTNWAFHLLQLNLDISGWANFTHVTYASPRRSSVHLFIPTDFNSATSDVHLVRYSGLGIIKTFVAKPRVLMLYAHTHSYKWNKNVLRKSERERKDIIILQRSYLYVVHLYIIIWRVYGGHCTFTSELVCSDNYAAV